MGRTVGNVGAGFKSNMMPSLRPDGGTANKNTGLFCQAGVWMCLVLWGFRDVPQTAFIALITALTEAVAISLSIPTPNRRRSLPSRHST